jgi:hypothetical protein
MSRFALRRPSVNYAGGPTLSPDPRPIERRESLKINATELLEEVTI